MSPGHWRGQLDADCRGKHPRISWWESVGTEQRRPDCVSGSPRLIFQKEMSPIWSAWWLRVGINKLFGSHPILAYRVMREAGQIPNTQEKTRTHPTVLTRSMCRYTCHHPRCHPFSFLLKINNSLLYSIHLPDPLQEPSMNPSQLQGNYGISVTTLLEHAFLLRPSSPTAHPHIENQTLTLNKSQVTESRWHRICSCDTSKECSFSQALGCHMTHVTSLSN